MKLALLLTALAVVSAIRRLDLRDHQGLDYEEVVILRKGDHLEVMMNEKPGTGYTWQVMVSDMEQYGISNILIGIGTKFTPNDESTGGSGVRTINFDTIAPGKGRLNLFHARSWELMNYINQGRSLD